MAYGEELHLITRISVFHSHQKSLPGLCLLQIARLVVTEKSLDNAFTGEIKQADR